jgi:catechol 2,3-dioxygenase-like lactoylglutathione lyase family enzyme
MPLTDAPLFASIPANDIERAKRWYQEKLGLTPAMDLGPAGQLYRSGGVQWLLYETPNAGTAKHTLGGWVIPDIDESMKELRANGVVFEEYDLPDIDLKTENGVARDPTGGASAWFKDSEGNILAVTQMPPGMALPGDVT